MDERAGSLLIIGNKGGTNVGGSLLKAGQRLGFGAHLIEMYQAMAAPAWLRRFNWRFRGHRPTWLGKFNKEVLEHVSEFRPNMLLATGTVPIQKKTLSEIGKRGVTRLNYLTDDPWNP